MYEFVVIGSSGMLGHRVLRSLYAMSQNSTVGIVQTNFDPMLPKNLQFKCSSLENILDVIDQIRPRVVINCAGLIKQNSLNCDNVDMINVNTLLPHMLANQGEKINYRLITISTDCVFDGKTGGYVESDVPSASDIYG
ncbi:MAG: sugar nucleotide-binding protein, partial [Paracoccaceae bacterium]